MFYFLSCNLENSELLSSKIAMINRNSKDGDIIKPALIREVNALSTEDWKMFGDGLIQLQDLPQKTMVVNKLNELKIKRLARWHVMQAPENVVPKEKSMPINCFIFTIAYVCSRN